MLRQTCSDSEDSGPARTLRFDVNLDRRSCWAVSRTGQGAKARHKTRDIRQQVKKAVFVARAPPLTPSRNLPAYMWTC